MLFHNKISKGELKAKLAEDKTKRTTLSFYRYVKIRNPEQLRDKLYIEWGELGVMGRIYLAKEGINAQMSLPTKNLENFRKSINKDKKFTDVPFKIAVEDDGKSFYKLGIKVRDKIVADGLDDPTFDSSKIGKHLSAIEFNNILDKNEGIVVDMRNHYESEIGRFEEAICPDADTFRQALPMAKEILNEKLQGKKDKKILLYCTGGIRCEKASAYLKHNGFKKVYQLQGGIIQYAKEVKEQKLESKFKGKNFVFDERVGERITNDIISKCHQCDQPCDTHVNCKNDACHLLFIQCDKCDKKFSGCCTIECQKVASLPVEKQRELRKGKNSTDCLAVYKSRLRPNLKQCTPIS